MDRLFVGHCLIDPASLTLQSKSGRTVVEPKVMALLQILAERPGQTWTRDEILSRVWPDGGGGDESLTRLVYMLRKAFRDHHAIHPVVATVPKCGYRLDVEVRREAAAPTRGLAADQIAAQPVQDFSIAVLPVGDASLEQSSRFLAEGMTRDLTSLISRTPRLRVAPYSSALYHAKPDLSPEAIAQALGVRYIVSSVLTRGGEAIRLRIDLQDTTNGNLIWSDKYDGALDEFLEIQSGVVLSISTAISAKVKASVYTLERGDGPFNLQAYERVQAAQSLLRNYSREAAGQIQMHLEDALALEPGNAVARSALAVQLSQNVVSQWTDDPKGMRDRADRYIDESLATAPHDPHVIAAAGIVSAMFHRPDDAIRHLERAVKLNPNSANALAVLGWQRCLRHLDRSGIEQIIAAETRAPHHHRFGLWATYKCTAYLFMLDYEKAVPACRDAIFRTPNYYQPYLSLAWALTGLGDSDSARDAIRQAEDFGYPNITDRFVEEMRKWSNNSPNRKACWAVLERLRTGDVEKQPVRKIQSAL